MGCLNSEGQFEHWFGNIHLSGPCNRSCYFCIGQHMMALDAFNTLDQWPLPGWDAFLAEAKAKDIHEVNLTGSNTDPLLYEHLPELTSALRAEIEDVQLGIRTNGVLTRDLLTKIDLFDKVSVSMHSFVPEIYKAMMGSGSPPRLDLICERKPGAVKLNIVMGPENIPNRDVLHTISGANRLGIERINLREPYGQPHIGDPFPGWGWEAYKTVHGMPCYRAYGCDVTYWDVHYCEVESVNLYANGRVSMTYPVTRGHAEDGVVEGQEKFFKSGRVREQWL